MRFAIQKRENVKTYVFLQIDKNKLQTAKKDPFDTTNCLVDVLNWVLLRGVKLGQVLGKTRSFLYFPCWFCKIRWGLGKKVPPFGKKCSVFDMLRMQVIKNTWVLWRIIPESGISPVFLAS
jgi:hypothetical protein